MMYHLSSLFIAVICSVSMINAQSSPMVVTPSISPDGTMISFSYQGDIWTVSAEGGIARRLTIHESYESHPQWSPDGSKLLFQGNRWGNNDIFAMDSDGGRPKRLTYFSGSDTNPKWIDNERILFSSRRGFVQVERESEIHTMSINGGTPQRMMDATALSPSTGQDIVAFVRGNCRVAREAYTGPANRNIWLHQPSNGSYRQLTMNDAQDILPNVVGGQVYFLSARDGRYNIYRQSVVSEDAVKLTNYTDEGITHFDVSADGNTIVYTHGTGLYTMSPSSPGDVNTVQFQVSEDDRFDPIEHMTYRNQATGFALSPSEDFVTLEIRGELFLKKNDKDKERTVQLTRHPFRDKEATWVNDSTILFSSDRDGDFDLYKLTSADGHTLYESFNYNIVKLTDHPSEEEGLVMSPDRSKIALQRGRGELVVMDVDSMGNLSNEITLVEGWDTPGGVSWSPDSKWLAYSLSDLNFNEEIYIHPADDSSEPVNVSLHPRGDYNPVWSADGSKLGFTSGRNNSDTDIWFVWLSKKDWEKTQREWEEEEDEKEKKSDSVVVHIDFENIHERLVQVTRMAGNEGNLAISRDGETFYFTTNGGGRQGSPGPSSLMSVAWDGSDMETVIKEIGVYGLTVDKDDKNIYAIKRGGTLTSINPSSKKQEGQRFMAKMDVDHRLEREQIFEEGWRRLRDGFYDPEFHGQDWNALKSQYKERSISATTDQDFRNCYNQMLGQLNASHMGMSGRNREETQVERTGMLGIDIKPTSQGIQVTNVVKGTPADREESKLEIGDFITAVNGTAITSTTNFYSLFEGMANERVMLEVRAADNTKREVIIRPTSSTRTAEYEAWVQARKDLTEKYSNGRLGYIHIRGMNWPSFERFERELTASGLGKEGVVIDVRFNGGGWTTDMLMTVLNVRQHSFTIPRGAAKSLEAEKDKFRDTYPFGERVPFSSLTKPSIALCNENSYSNAEIFSHAYQGLGHGTLVGRPTFGAVISTGSAGLLNGYRVRMPFRAWYVKHTNKNMEHGPAIPDIEVFNQPDSKANNEDPQLETAVEKLLSEIDAG